MLFLSSNGVGVGHLARLLAVARRLPDTHAAVFLTMSQALPVIEQFGFTAEHIPGDRSTLSGHEAWNEWLRLELELVLDAYSIRAVVYDGNIVYPGITDALSDRSDCPLVWLRRGMWRSDQDNAHLLELGRHADLIVEPDDVASELDTGASADARDGVTVVPPIRLLDDVEVLGREQSCARLGLDPGDRYVLIQLGTGNNTNIIDLIDGVLDDLRRVGGFIPVIAEWLTADLSLDLWPEVPRLRCFPLSRYYRAFDFTISAVGYNTFNEIISFGVPAVLVPNLNRSMDDQGARARFAHQRGAAVHLDPGGINDLPNVLEEMRNGCRRDELRQNCARISKPNGAGDVAELLNEIRESGARDQ
jgi:UDP:flavonoid glycosyltransferase YjiC (YdhE family)